MKEMGFNMVRKHIKIEVGANRLKLFFTLFTQVDRWYYWADRLGLLVWQVGKFLSDVL